ncbi:MAG: RagB/SusD family nutrient uptake outer membrane protein, partial [Chlamydiia bacterium]|nr:RagB/SusD family nutrient uptake outer membrane protein [Chlamydiia bacterium]
KYLGRDTGSKNVVDAKVIRMAEVLLSMSEAFYNNGDENNARKYLDLVKAERYSDFSTTSVIGSKLIEAILLERRKELAFEGMRFFDIKRLNLSIERSNFGDFADGTGTPVPNFAKVLNAGSYKLELAIPQDELNANTNMKQNPQY